MTITNKQIDKTRAAIEKNVDGRIQVATDAGNAGLAKKWVAVKLGLMPCAQAVAELGLNPKTFIPNAIYAAQKTERMIRTFADGINRIDAYTANLIRTGVRSVNGGSIANKVQNGALSKFMPGEFGDALDHRLVRATTTASTQASSTRKALEGLGLASNDQRVMTLTLDNPLGAKLLLSLGFTPAEETPVEEPEAEVVVGASAEELPVEVIGDDSAYDQPEVTEPETVAEIVAGMTDAELETLMAEAGVDPIVAE